MQNIINGIEFIELMKYFLPETVFTIRIKLLFIIMVWLWLLAYTVHLLVYSPAQTVSVMEKSVTYMCRQSERWERESEGSGRKSTLINAFVIYRQTPGVEANTSANISRRYNGCAFKRSENLYHQIMYCVCNYVWI